MLNLLAVLTCVIVVPTDQQPGHLSPRIVYEHELAHCNGWEHGGNPNNLRNIIPPRSFVHKPKMALDVLRVPTDTARMVCRAVGGDSYGCQYFE